MVKCKCSVDQANQADLAMRTNLRINFNQSISIQAVVQLRISSERLEAKAHEGNE